MALAGRFLLCLAALDLLLEVVHPLLVITPALKIDGVLPALIVLILILDLVFLVREFRVQTVELRRQGGDFPLKTLIFRLMDRRIECDQYLIRLYHIADLDIDLLDHGPLKRFDRDVRSAGNQFAGSLHNDIDLRQGCPDDGGKHDNERHPDTETYCERQTLIFQFQRIRLEFHHFLRYFIFFHHSSSPLICCVQNSR